MIGRLTSKIILEKLIPESEPTVCRFLRNASKNKKDKKSETFGVGVLIPFGAFSLSLGLFIVRP